METTARGDAPKALHNIAFVSIPESADLEFLLWDLQDAIAAYARLSGTSLPRLVALETDDGGSAADGIVFAVENALNNEAMSVVEQALDCLGGTETRVYVVVLADCGSPERAHTVVGHLREACERRGLSWCGGIVVCTGTGIAALRHSPRMGLLRRPFSEAMDKLVGAVRMGCSVEHAQRLGGGSAEDVDTNGMVFAEPAVPAPIWQAVIKRLGAHAQSNI
ncbi:MAG: hypothetical protein ACLUS0_03880 [Collinsella sp.]